MCLGFTHGTVVPQTDISAGKISTVISCLALLDADRVRVPTRALHTEADDVRPFLTVRVHLVNRELLEHLTLRLQLVQFPLVFLGGHLLIEWPRRT